MGGNRVVGSTRVSARVGTSTIYIARVPSLSFESLARSSISSAQFKAMHRTSFEPLHSKNPVVVV